jgi:hypothetical protein
MTVTFNSNLSGYSSDQFIFEEQLVKLTGRFASKPHQPGIKSSDTLRAGLVEVEFLQPTGKDDVIRICKWVKFHELYRIEN